MTNDWTGKIILSLVGAFIHLQIVAVYWYGGKSASFPLTWSYPYTLLMLIMALMAIIMPFLRNSKNSKRLLFIRFVFTAILTVPSNGDPLSFGFIFSLLMFEGFLYFSTAPASLLCLACIAYTIFLVHTPLYLWFIPPEQPELTSLLLTFALYAICGMIGFYLRREIRLRHKELKIISELLESNVNLASININLQNLAVDERNNTLTQERNRIAREIHDTVAYTLTNLLSLLNAYREQMIADSQEVPENINQARGLVREGLGDIRKVLRALRPGENEGYQGLWGINHLVNVFSKATGITVLLNYGRTPQFPGNDIEDVLYRVVQEGLTNSFRHGRATEVIINFHYDNDGIEAVISDNGRGSEIAAGGFGLMGITERVKSLKGTAAFFSKPGLGFTLNVWLPLTREDEAHGTAKDGHRR